MSVIEKQTPKAQTIDDGEIFPLPELSITKISAEELDANARRYPEFGWEDITEDEISDARTILLSLPLVHRTGHQRFSGDAPVESTLYDTPTSQSQLRHIVDEHNAMRLDMELDLDEFVFMGWGAPLSRHKDSWLKDARYAVLVDSRILLDDTCLVTEMDIADVVHDDVLHDGVEGVSPEDRIDILGYRAGVVRGSDWIEIMARRLARHIKENPGEPYDLDIEDLGEVKIRNTVPQSAIIGSLDLTDRAEYAQFLEHVTELTRGHVALRGLSRRAAWFKRH